MALRKRFLSYPYIGRQILFRWVTIYVRVLLTFCNTIRSNLIILIYYQLVRFLCGFFLRVGKEFADNLITKPTIVGIRR